MANLSGLTSDGRTAWGKYVVAAAPGSLAADYTTTIEGASLVDKNGKLIAAFSKSTKITFLSVKLTKIGKFTAANVKIPSLTLGKGITTNEGYLNLTQINKPTKSSSGPKTAINFGLLKIYQIGKKPVVTSVYKLNSPSPKERGESDFINSINSIITQPMNLMIGSTTYKNICGVNKVAGTPKADLVFVALERNKFVEVCFVSHKMGKTEKEFGQWSGVTQSAGGSIANAKQVTDFIKQVRATKEETFDKMKATFTIIKKIEGSDGDVLKKRSMYGPDFGSKRGRDNVDFLLQGTPSIRGGKLLMSTSLHPNGVAAKGGFDPCLMVYRKGTTGDRDQFDIPGARFTISPIGGRKANFIIDSKGKLIPLTA